MKEYKVVAVSIKERSIGFLGFGGSKTGKEAFEDDINALLAEGWECQGGICMVLEGKNEVGLFVQALVRDLPQ